MPYKKGKRVKRRTHKEDAAELVQKIEAPKSLVFCRGKVGREVNQLMLEWREAMLPFTAERLKVVKRNKVKDIVELAKLYSCTTVHSFTCSPMGTHFRLIKAPQGPTLTFRVESFKLRADVMKESGKNGKYAVTDAQSYSRPPLLVFNQLNTGRSEHQLIMTTMQGMFPSITVDSFKLSHCHRVLLVNYNKADDQLELRHYGVLARSAGVSAAAKKLAKNQLPRRLGELDSVDDLFRKGGDYLSDTDGEGEEVELAQNFRKMQTGTNTRLKLVEIGPRLTLSLMRVEAGFWGGETIYHKLFTKTPEEACETARRIKLRARLKQLRKTEQDANVTRKKEAKEVEKAKKRVKPGADAPKQAEDAEDFEVLGDESAGSAPEAGSDGAAEAPRARKRVRLADDAEELPGGGGGEEHFDDADDDDAVGASARGAEDEAPKRRKAVPRGKRREIKKWKQMENTRGEAQ